jgi:glycosyltransferase involved in cell wall biosynthesis
LFVGEGAVKSNLIELAKRKRLNNVTFLPGQPRERVADFYHLADVCLVPLRDVPGLSTFIPSKMFEIMGCGKPIIAPLQGEAADILNKSGAALVISPENPEELVRAIKVLKGDPERCQRMGWAGRLFVENNYDRKKLAREYLVLLEKVANKSIFGRISGECLADAFTSEFYKSS